MLERQRRRMGAADGQRGRSPPAPSRAFEHDPMRRHGAFGAAGHHEADLGRVSAGRWRRNSSVKRQRRIAAAEIVDQAVALGLAEHRDDALRIDPAGGDRRLDAADVVGRSGGDAVDLGDRHGGSPFSSRAVRLRYGCDQRALELGSAAASAALSRHAGAQPRQQLVAHRRIDRCRAPCRPHDRAAGDDQLAGCDATVARANSRSQRIEIGAQALVVDRVPVEQQNVGRRAGRERAAVVLVGDREAAVAKRHASASRRGSTSIWKPVPRCSRCASRISRSASSSSSSVVPSRPSATRQPRSTISRDRRDAGAQMQVRAGVDRDRDAALGEQFQFVRPRPGAMRERQARAEQADRVEIVDDAVGIVGVDPSALVAGFQQMHVDAAAGARRGLGDRREQFVRAPLHAPAGRIARRTSGLPAAAATASTSAICSATDSGGRMKRLPISSRAVGRQRGQDRLRRPIDQRIAVAHRDRKADAHADIARGARDLGHLGRQIGQALHARVVHHDGAGAAERAARQRHRGGEIGIDRRQQRQIVQSRFPAACRRRRASVERTARA